MFIVANPLEYDNFLCNCEFAFSPSKLPLQNVPPAILLRFLREHRSEWADNNIDAYSAAAVKVGPWSLPGSRVGSFGNQVILPLAHTIEHEEVGCMIKILHCRELFFLRPLIGLFHAVNDTKLCFSDFSF